jgi:hypothetical protein
MSKRSDHPRTAAGIPAGAQTPPQAQVEAAITRVIDAVVPKQTDAERQGGALKRADEIGRAERRREKPAC